ncbi:hypothetical protein PENANT_c013G00197 [Penicillium antarcticum]|uniref:Uncharacterized protein n=1 Tax=Penicillium antarcticum TaxID=416450 RepID=A0A1V6Q568_9EURO|nr:hypothetical protein PENANT_c013G00197 [Penicillium antarcticum]
MTIQEVRNMHLVAEKTMIPVPGIHEVCRQEGKEGNKVAAILRNYVPGKPFDEAWDALNNP